MRIFSRLDASLQCPRTLQLLPTDIIGLRLGNFPKNQEWPGAGRGHGTEPDSVPAASMPQASQIPIPVRLRSKRRDRIQRLHGLFPTPEFKHNLQNSANPYNRRASCAGGLREVVVWQFRNSLRARAISYSPCDVAGEISVEWPAICGNGSSAQFGLCVLICHEDRPVAVTETLQKAVHGAPASEHHARNGRLSRVHERKFIAKGNHHGQLQRTHSQQPKSWAPQFPEKSQTFDVRTVSAAG